MAPLQGGVYRRSLGAPAIAFSSPEGRSLFQEALVEGTAEMFAPLIEQFHTQEDPSFCGLATLVMALNALNVDPGSKWRGHWRWYDESCLSCCKDLEDIKAHGIEWEEWICLAQCQGLLVDALRADDEGTSLAAFEAHCAAMASQPGGQVLVLSYSRKAVGQTGDGHYSPIGAYHRGRSLALVLDTARFKYPPHWLPVAQLWEAMSVPNPSTGRSRGYATLSRGDVCGRSLFSLKVATEPWRVLNSWLWQNLPNLMTAEEATAEAELQLFVRSIPPAVAALVSENCYCLGLSSAARSEAHSAVLEALHQTAAYRTLAAASRAHPTQTLPASMESLTILMLILGHMGVLSKAMPHAEKAGLWKSLGRSRQGADASVEEMRRRGVLRDELQFMLKQAKNLIAKGRSHSSVSSCSCCQARLKTPAPSETLCSKGQRTLMLISL